MKIEVASTKEYLSCVVMDRVLKQRIVILVTLDLFIVFLSLLK